MTKLTANHPYYIHIYILFFPFPVMWTRPTHVYYKNYMAYM